MTMPPLISGPGGQTVSIDPPEPDDDDEPRSPNTSVNSGGLSASTGGTGPALPPPEPDNNDPPGSSTGTTNTGLTSSSPNGGGDVATPDIVTAVDAARQAAGDGPAVSDSTDARMDRAQDDPTPDSAPNNQPTNPGNTPDPTAAGNRQAALGHYLRGWSDEMGMVAVAVAAVGILWSVVAGGDD